MAPNMKRTRSTTHENEENAPPTPPATGRMTRRAPTTTIVPSTTTTTTTPTPAPTTTTLPPTPTSITPSRPIQTRSSTTYLAPPTPLTRTSSLFTPSTRRANGASGGSSFSSLSFASSSSSPIAGPSTRGGTLMRTQSTPVLSSPENIKAGAVASGSSGRGKGDPADDVFGGPRRFGKGKENIPPKKDAENDDAGSSRKRLRVGSRGTAGGSGSNGSGSGSGRGRSGSVASVRSESSSGPSLFSRRSTVFPSPSPSPSIATSQSIDSASSIDPFDLLVAEDIDVDKTPTKSRVQPSRRSGIAPLPTPPSSSPVQAEIDATGRRIALVRMDSTVSIAATETGTETETEDNSPSDVNDTPIKAKNPYKYLKSFLRLSSAVRSTSSEVIGREDEKAVLRSYFSLRSTSDVGLYVSGPPGTGKTALVTSMGRELAGEGWNVVDVGCMGVKVGDIWTRLAEQLGCDKSENAVRDVLVQGQQNKLIILDEVDSLLSPAPSLPPPATSHLLSRLFSLPILSTADCTVKFIAISNTLDLTVRARLVLPEGTQPQVLPFKAYGTSEMVDIVKSRMVAAAADREDADTVKIDLKAIELLTRKVEAQNGDLRMCLASLSSAVNLAEAEWVKKAFTLEAADNAQSVPLVKVSLPHVIKAFTSHTQQLKAAAGSSLSMGGTTGSPTFRKIRSVPLQGKMVLASILIYLSRCRVGLPGCPSASTASSPNTSPSKHGDLTTSTLYATYSYLLSHASSPFPPAAESDYRDLLSNLETLGLVSLYGGGGSGSSAGMIRSSSSSSGRGKGAGGPRVELCLPEEDLKAGLGLKEDQAGKVAGAGGVGDEEVAKMWSREEMRIGKARERLARAAEALAGVEKDA